MSRDSNIADLINMPVIHVTRLRWGRGELRWATELTAE